jgi:hypothetical protein
MRKRQSEEFENFERFMDKLAKVPHSELKAKLEKEKEQKLRKATQEQNEPTSR